MKIVVCYKHPVKKAEHICSAYQESARTGILLHLKKVNVINVWILELSFTHLQMCNVHFLRTIDDLERRYLKQI